MDDEIRYEFETSDIEWAVDWPDERGREMQFDPSMAVAHLILNNVLFLNGFFTPPSKAPIQVFVLCSDVFAWGCADCEELPFDEIKALYTLWKADPTWGPARWCILRRNRRPQEPVVMRMKEAGAWDAALDALPRVP